MFGLLALAAAAIITPAQEDGPDILVTAERIGDLRNALAACLARACPVNEDVDATLAVAEAEFLNGDYDAAATTIRRSIGRNRRQASGFPEPVADLYRSGARVFSHMGRDPEAERATRAILTSLNAGIPIEDHRHLTARLELVEMLLRRGNVYGAQRALAALRDRAEAAGRADVARMASMRLLRIDDQIDPRGPARRRLLHLSQSTIPGERFEAVSARLYLAARHRQAGDIARADALLAGLPRPEGDRRALLYAPRIALDNRRTDLPGDIPNGNPLRLASNVLDEQWIDVGYWIGADGRVQDVEIIRRGTAPDWTAPLIASVRGRLYEASADGSPSYRVERYTYTAPFTVLTGSRLPQRSPRVRIEMMDLTTPAEPGRAPSQALTPAGSTR